MKLLLISSNTCCFYDRRYISKRIPAPVCMQQLNVSVNTQGQSMKRQTLKWEIYEMKSKWRVLHHSTNVIALHHSLYLSFLTWFPFFVSLCLFLFPCSPVLFLSVNSRKALFILHIQSRSTESLQSCSISVSPNNVKSVSDSMTIFSFAIYA